MLHLSQRKKKPRHTHARSDLFDNLPDDIVISILSRLISSASSPSGFITILVTCKRLNRLGLHPLVLSRAGKKTLSITAKNWSEHAHRFLKLCVSAGNVEASYILGMIRFYCLQNRRSGASLMAKAAIKCHAHALYSLAVIHFNGSGGSKNDKDLRAGVALCARAAFFGNVDALRELGHCIQDGYGIRQSIADGRRLLVQANARELASVLRCNRPSSFNPLTWQSLNPRPPSDGGSVMGLDPEVGTNLGWALWSDFGCNVPAGEAHPVNTFLVEWFGLRISGPGHELRMCSHSRCGRPETRRSEFRRCSGCGKVHYCSRGCQAHDWKVRHKVECAQMDQDGADEEGGDDDEDDYDDEGHDPSNDNRTVQNGQGAEVGASG